MQNGKDMTKFTRHDPRNKKNGRHKDYSLKKDIRIRNVDEENSPKITRPVLNKLFVEEVQEEISEVH